MARSNAGQEARHATIHATAVSIGRAGVLFRGPSGSGKSDLALRMLALHRGPLVAEPPCLVADDRVIIERGADAVFMSCPPVLAGLIEVRGLGIITVPSIARAELSLVVDLVVPGEVERMPDPADKCLMCGTPVARMALWPFEASAPLKVALAAARTLAQVP